MKKPSIEFESIEKIKIFQEEKLKNTLHYLLLHSPYYQKVFQENHIDISKIKTIEDLKLIPLTEKSDLQLFN
ncbi:MAG TPA: phenylacetate--CoA ligase family protein, partial [Bacteroidales bacterium]|nr:phenylacetate--CoA ligase family protein [Bacteroidales bacterium]